MKNKYMKNLFTVVAMLFTVQIKGNDWQKIDYEKVDRITVVHGKSDPWRLKKPLLIFDNSNLTGKPIFKIDNEQVLDLRASKAILMPKVDFLNYVNDIHGIDLKISNYFNGIAEVLEQGKKYYLKFSKKSFDNGDYSFVSWRRFHDVEALKIYENISTSDKELKNVIKEVNKCIENKSAQCLAQILNVDEFKFYRMAHFYWRYLEKKECTDLEEEWIDAHLGGGAMISRNDELTEFKKNYIIPWDLLKKVFNEKLKSENVLIRTKNFGKVDMIEIDYNDELICKGRFKKNVYLEIKKDLTEKKITWKIELVGNFIKDTSGIDIIH